MKSNNSKVIIAAFAITSCFAIIPTTKTLANETNPVITQAAQPTIKVKVLSQQDEFVTVEVTLNQSVDQNSKLTINDEKGDAMYEENVNTKTFSRKIKLASSEIGKIEIVFSTPKIDVKKMYAINVAIVSKVNITEEKN